MEKNIIIIFLGIILFITGLHRIFIKKEREYEAYNVFYLPKYSDIIIIIFEIIIGLGLLINNNYKKYFLILLLIFMIFACCLIVYHHRQKIIDTYVDAFTFKPTFIHLTLHSIYVLIIIIALYPNLIKS